MFVSVLRVYLAKKKQTLLHSWILTSRQPHRTKADDNGVDENEYYDDANYDDDGGDGDDNDNNDSCFTQNKTKKKVDKLEIGFSLPVTRTGSPQAEQWTEQRAKYQELLYISRS